MAKPLDDTTAPRLVRPDLLEQPRARPEASRVGVAVAARTHPGRVRTRNEDHFLVSRFDRSMDVLASNLEAGSCPEPFRESGFVFQVADGMGGRRAGEVASRLALALGARLAVERARWNLRFEDGMVDVVDRVVGILRDVDRELGERADADPTLQGMGTTLTTVLSFGTELLVFQVGDSRAYRFHAGKLERLTRDQTVAQVLADMGAIPADAVARHPRKHVLVNVMGRRGGQLEVEWQSTRIGDGDWLLLASDGLTEHVDDAAIAAVLERAADPERSCDELLGRALEGGGSDNITVVLARYSVPE